MTQQNRSAFLFMLAFSEGTQPLGDRGYNVLFGGKLFDSYADHPRVHTHVPRLGIYTTAAGRYQILARIFDSYKSTLNLPDFSPDSQDAIAIQLIKERNALSFVDSGKLSLAIERCAPIWASLPGANYNQPERKLEVLQAVFASAGGRLI